MFDGLSDALGNGDWWKGMVAAFIQQMKAIFKGLGGDGTAKGTAKGMLFNPGITSVNAAVRLVNRNSGRFNFGTS
jgi:hypothetical protein